MAERKPSRLKKSSAVAAAAVAAIGGFEGLRQTAYPDPATRGKPWTICYGHTEGVKPGDRASIAECKSLLLADLEGAARRIEACVRVDLTDGQYVAVLSLAHNIGAGGTCRSSVVRLFNAHQPRAACDALLKFNRAAGIVWPGLTRRRQAERRLCLNGI